jgi:hypothetical protein
LGVIVIQDGSVASFGVLDIDAYRDFDPASVASAVAKFDLPLVVCRSKSGGAHVCLFASEPIDAGIMQDKLRDLAAKLGYGSCEVFPKQRTLKPTECGAWVNLPYHDSSRATRYALKANGDALSLEAFLDYAESIRVGPDFFKAPDASAPEPLPQGPPCLQHLVTLGIPEGGRNNTLLNLGIYAKHVNPSTFQDDLEGFNRQYVKPPLNYQEVGDIVKSLTKKDYRYMCDAQPLTPYCNAVVCRTRKYGIGGGTAASLPVLGTLTKYDSDPPIFFWDVDGERIELTDSEVMEYSKFKRACFRRLNKMLPDLTKKKWEELVRKALEKLVIEIIPRDASIPGQFEEHLRKFCTRMFAHSKEEMLLGKPWTDEAEGRTYFFIGDLSKYLGERKFNYLAINELGVAIKLCGGRDARLSIDGEDHRAWSVPAYKRPRRYGFPVPDSVDEDARPF